MDWWIGRAEQTQSKSWRILGSFLTMAFFKRSRVSAVGHDQTNLHKIIIRRLPDSEHSCHRCIVENVQIARLNAFKDRPFQSQIKSQQHEHVVAHYALCMMSVCLSTLQSHSLQNIQFWVRVERVRCLPTRLQRIWAICRSESRPVVAVNSCRERWWMRSIPAHRKSRHWKYVTECGCGALIVWRVGPVKWFHGLNDGTAGVSIIKRLSSWKRCFSWLNQQHKQDPPVRAQIKKSRTSVDSIVHGKTLCTANQKQQFSVHPLH